MNKFPDVTHFIKNNSSRREMEWIVVSKEMMLNALLLQAPQLIGFLPLLYLDLSSVTFYLILVTSAWFPNLKK